MVYIIVKRSDREIRERMNEAPKRWQRTEGVTGYARDPGEAAEIMRQRGSDNPNAGNILCDDGGKAEKDLRDRTLRGMGVNPEAYDGH